jgi:anti-anti-sigma regulatory factor
MKRDLMSSATTHNGGHRGLLGDRKPKGSGSAMAAREKPHLTLVPQRPWSHTLILKGSLDHDSAAELHEELECLQQEGVTDLTLDLRQLDELDPLGAQVITSQSAFFEGRGRRFAVLVSSPALEGTLSEAGAGDLLVAPRTAEAAQHLSRFSSHTTDLSTSMVREVGLG